MLLLVGLGLDTKDLSVGALEAIKKSNKLFLDTHTAFIPESYKRFIEKETGRKIVPLSRQDLEDRVKQTVASAKRENVAILVPGDPLIATTHDIILNEAQKQRIKCHVFHSLSVVSVAIGESGLDVYRFGPTVTIPFWFPNYEPTSFLDVIKNNQKNKQHTLLLLDIDQKNKSPMSIEYAMYLLSAADKKAKANFIRTDLRFIILANLGRKDQKVKYLKMKEVSAKIEKELKNKILSLVIPAKMTFAEEENISRATKPSPR